MSKLAHSNQETMDQIEASDDYAREGDPPDLIRQRCNTDCVLCCLAMATGRTYEDVAEAIGADLREKFLSHGADGNDDQTALQRLGYVKDRDYLHLIILPEYVGLGFLRNVLWGRRVIMGVKSKNKFEQTHALYFDGRTLLDPCTKKTYVGMLGVEPIDIILFNERPLSEVDQRIAEWIARNPGELEAIAIQAGAAAKKILSDAMVTPEQTRRPVDF